MPNLTDRLKHAWNAFTNNRDPTYNVNEYSSSYRPDRLYLSRGNERTIVTSIYNRIALDVSSISINHVRLDDNGRYITTIESSLNNALTLEANRDQTGRAFIQDVVLSMFDEGCVAIVPVETSINPLFTGSYEIETMRTGKITQWYPDHVRVLVYNDKKGLKEEITLPKKMVCIIENPFYSIMNQPNSTLQRLIRKLALLDQVDEQSGAGKLDMIIQLPYVIRSEARRQEAERRRKDIENQLAGSKYGIAYTDSTEKVTQINRSLENHLLEQVDYLTNLLYSQLGLTDEIMNGNASETAMLNYYNRTIEPIISSITDEIKRKFLTKTARSQKQSIAFFRDPFKLVPVASIADIADKFTRNEIMSSNEVRGLIGFKPVDDPDADALRNKNLNQSNEEIEGENAPEESDENNQNGTTLNTEATNNG